MSATRKERKERQTAYDAPKNFKCGRCGKVQPYNEDLKCVDCDKEEE